jgi:hypothetical protein
MKLSDLGRINNKSISSAGPRYTPGLNASAPNIEIESLNTAIEGLVCGDSFKKRVDNICKSIEKSWKAAYHSLKETQFQQLEKPSKILEKLAKLGVCPPRKGKLLIRSTRTNIQQVNETVGKLFREIGEEEEKRYEELRKGNKESKKYYSAYETDPKISSLRSMQRSIRKYEDTLDSANEFLNSPGCNLQFNNVALLLGAWGTGKTHFLCDLTCHRLRHGFPVLLVLAKDFDPGNDVCQALANFTHLFKGFENLIRNLNMLGESKGERALLLIDGVNESDHDAWRKCIQKLIRILRQNQYVGLIISCRQPFDSLIFPSNARKEFVELIHHGFTDVEFDAQTEFFKFYNIPLPEVPLLAEEFSRPLTLKIMCEAFNQLPQKERRKGFAGIASGQRGMTFILETFINNRASSIEKSLGLPRKLCWSLIKGDERITNPHLAGIAPNMAERLTEYVSKEDCLQIIQTRKETRQPSIAKKLYRRLITEGILSEDVVWRPVEEGGPITVVRLPYQRFSDHIIARHLLARYLNTKNEKSIRRSFHIKAPLGKLFSLPQAHFHRYEMESWVEALIVEFPERVKKVLPEEKRELFYYLPKARRDLSAYYNPFVGGLFWRSSTSISQQTDNIVGIYFWQTDEYWRYKIIEAMLSVATKPEHPYNANRLYVNLERLQMPDRDLHWTEFIRKRISDSTIERLLRWFETHIPEGLTEENALNQIILLSLILTTTDRLLRDRITKVLVLIGEQFPAVLFKHTERTLNFNDPYVPERMLAACYGVAMSLWADRNEKSFYNILHSFAKVMVKEIFLPGGKLLTSHVLIREYALGIIDIARKCHPGCIATKNIKYLKPPFPGVPNLFPNYEDIKESDCKGAQYAIHMDFGNYTIGHLIPNRRNYDMEAPRYKDVRRKIEWRIVNLGYTDERFEKIDRRIGEENYYNRDNGKIDRYGKKYSWIAYFEMYGLVQSARQLPDYRQHERTSDCDIDPSFPDRPPFWKPNFPKIMKATRLQNVEWLINGPTPNYHFLMQIDNINNIDGPWVLLEGYIKEKDSPPKRELITFINGFILKEEDIPMLRKRLADVDHPGSELPYHSGDTYTFAGEIPWSKRFAASIRTNIGKLSQKRQEAFSFSLTIPKRRRVKKAWKLLYKELGEIPKLDPRAIILSEIEPDQLKLIESKITIINKLVPEREQLANMDLFWDVPTIEEINKGYQTLNIWKRFPGIKVEATHWHFGWESYHSKLNDFSGFLFPSPYICEHFNLVGHRRSIDLFDSLGRKASLYRESQKGDLPFFELLYLRKDLLNEYLCATNRKLVWIVWGERQFHYDALERLMHEQDIEVAFQAHQHMHKKLVQYNEIP